MTATHVLNRENSESDIQRLNVGSPTHYAIDQATRISARIVAIAFGSAGLSIDRAARASGVSRNLAHAWTQTDGRRGISLCRILTMASSSRRGRDAARSILTAALSHVEAEADIPAQLSRDLRDEVVSLAAEAGEVAAVVRASLADGVVDESERKQIAAELQDVEEVCRKMRLALIGGANG